MKFRNNVRAAAETFHDRLNDLRTDLPKQLLAVAGSFLILIVVVVGGAIIWLSDKAKVTTTNF